MQSIHFSLLFVLTQYYGIAQFDIASEVELIKVVMNLDNGDKNKGYIIHINEESIFTINKKEHVSSALANDCRSCEVTPIKQIRRLIIKSNKRHIGKIIGVISIGLPAAYIGAETTIEEGSVSSRIISHSLFYGGIGACIGAGSDIMHNYKKDKRGMLVKRQVYNSRQELKDNVERLERYSVQYQIEMLNREGFINFYTINSDQID